MLPLSICMIAKNEQAYIGECLNRLTTLNCEIILVDTGSTDKTVEIASRYTASIYSYNWNNNFSDARNFSVSKATNSWILYIDCDEFLEHNSAHVLEQNLAHIISAQSPYHLGTILLENQNTTTNSLTMDTLTRLFNKDCFNFTGSVHEQLSPVTNHSVAYFATTLCFKHMGYLNSETLLLKAHRNINLLLLQLNKDSSNPYLLFQLGQCYYSIKDWTQALFYFEQAITFDINPSLNWVQTLIESYGYCLLNLKQLDQALLLENVYDSFSSHADFVFLMGLIYMNCGRFEDAIEQFKKATRIPFYSVKGTNSFMAEYNCGVIYECSGQKDAALHHYTKCGIYAPAMEALKRLKTI